MSRLIRRVTALILPKAEAKAVRTRGRCSFGCGRDGVYNVGSVLPKGLKPPCC